jgi:toxin HigB-1
VQLKFENAQLERLAYEVGYSPKGWGSELVRSYRRTVNLLHAALDERDVRNIKGLRLEKLLGKRKGTHSVRINNQVRLIIRFDGRDPSRVIVIIDAIDYH